MIWPFSKPAAPNGVDAAAERALEEAEQDTVRAYALRDDLKKLNEAMQAEQQRPNGAAKPAPPPDEPS